MGYGQMRLIGVLVGTLTVAVAAAACGSSLPGTSAQARSAGAPPTLTTPSTSPTTASSTTTAPCIAPDGCTTISPNTYHPSYDSIPALASDAAAVFIGTALPLRQDGTSGGTFVPFSVDQLLYGEIPRTYPEPPISQGDPGDVPVVVGNQYLVFWTIDSNGPLHTCVVGGTRGIFDYDARTQTVTRIATGASQIPTTLTLSQLTALLPNPNVPTPARVPSPPFCSPSVTGS
jgi:hypothetical protein